MNLSQNHSSYKSSYSTTSLNLTGGGQNLERRNVERPIFRDSKIANITITKEKLFDNFIFEFNFLFFKNHLNTQNI